MATVVSQRVRHLGRYLGYFKNFILRKTTANSTEISRKHVFAASNSIIIKNRVWEQIFPKIYSFLFQTLICIINYV